MLLLRRRRMRLLRVLLLLPCENLRKARRGLAEAHREVGNELA